MMHLCVDDVASLSRAPDRPMFVSTLPSRPTFIRASRDAHVARAKRADNGAGAHKALGLPIHYHRAPPRPSNGKSTFGESKCEQTVEELDTCSLRNSTEVYDTLCKACRGNKLVISVTKRGGKMRECISTCQSCGGTGYVRVSTTRVAADFEGDDSEAAEFHHFKMRSIDDGPKIEYKRNIFDKFEKSSSKKMEQNNRNDPGRSSR